MQRARRLLVDPRIASRTISAIAFDVGFGDLSSFNRAFRRAFDATPSDIRQLARSQRAVSSPLRRRSPPRRSRCVQLGYWWR